jgi:hypothetical protein
MGSTGMCPYHRSLSGLWCGSCPCCCPCCCPGCCPGDPARGDAGAWVGRPLAADVFPAAFPGIGERDPLAESGSPAGSTVAATGEAGAPVDGGASQVQVVLLLGVHFVVKLILVILREPRAPGGAVAEVSCHVLPIAVHLEVYSHQQRQNYVLTQCAKPQTAGLLALLGFSNTGQAATYPCGAPEKLVRVGPVGAGVVVDSLR